MDGEFLVPNAGTDPADAVLANPNILDAPSDERFARATRIAYRLYDADAAYLGLIESDRLWVRAGTGPLVPTFVERQNSVCCSMAADGKPLVIGDLRQDPNWSHMEQGFGMRFYAGVPLVASTGASIGSLCILKQAPADPRDIDLGPLRELAAMVMDAIELWQRNVELNRISQMDSLTGIANRRAFDDVMDRAVRRARRTGEPVSVILLDLDRFKPLNDALGHQAGDTTLRSFARLLEDSVRRPHDFVSRYGGEEFAVILPDTDEAGAHHVAANIQKTLFEMALVNPAGPGGQLTTSIGIASRTGAAADTHGLIADADAALYRAKADGRGCTRGSALVIPPDARSGGKAPSSRRVIRRAP